MLLKAALIWLVLSVLAVLNGLARNSFITPKIGEHGGHVASTILFCTVIFIVSLMSIRWMGPESRGNAWLIGIVWLVLTVSFEFLAGHYLFGSAWSKLLADYNLANGRIWLFVLLTTFFAPWCAAAIRGI